MSDIEHITVSKGNMKMGTISSLSFPPIVTCCEEACNTCAKESCYALRMYKNKMRKSVGLSWDKNLRIYKSDPTQFWRETEAAIMSSRVFRFFVSGDIPDVDFFYNLVDIVERNKHCEILMFTKKFSIVNNYLENHNYTLPENFHVVFSAWRGLKMNNPYMMPECHILYKTGECTAPEHKPCFICSGNCFECFCTHQNCYSLRKGEAVLIKEH